MAIIREPDVFSRRNYDLIIIGGGIYGAMLALEATFRELRPLLLERNDFGGATSFNSLRIVHGGLRYLQTLDLKRHLQSVQERRWLLKNFPDLIHPLPCLMPLYGRGARRKSILRVVLQIDDLLSAYRNLGVPGKNSLPGGTVLSQAETVAAFPGVVRNGLQGAATWHDAAMPDSQRIVIEVLRWATRNGADVVNYVDVQSLSLKHNAVAGVVARDTLSGSELDFRAPIVVNAAGPWCVKVADTFDAKAEDVFWPSLAWNILTNRPPPSEYALAVTPSRPDGPTYFLHPWKGKLFIGTGHACWNGPVDCPAPSERQIQETIDDVNSSIPDLALDSGCIDRVVSGILPAIKPRSAKLSTRPTLVDHSKRGGPSGFITLCGVKFTTARRVAAHALDRIFGPRQRAISTAMQRPRSTSGWQSASVDLSRGLAVDSYVENLRHLIADESAMNLQDIVFRRTDLWVRQDLALRLAPEICDLFDWPESRKTVELVALANKFQHTNLVARTAGEP